MNYFTSDLHLGHRNIIRLCNRPFATIEEMDETLIRNWNAKVTNGDTVYILGDLLFRNEKPAEEYLKQLKGKKHLIIGNHDRDWVKKCNLKDFFESVNNLHFISDGKRQMTLCHYPMMSWPHMTRCYMVFGHIHGNTDADYWPLIRENDLMLNAGADVNGFAPVTFEEMQENNYRHKAGWNPVYYGGRPMKLREYHPLSEMERVPAEELPKRLDELFDRMDKENVGFVVTEEGKDSCVFCPYKWFELEYETIEVAVDEVLLAQIKEIITPLGWTVERLIVRFLEWLVDPETQEEAIAWLMKAKEELGEK